MIGSADAIAPISMPQAHIWQLNFMLNPESLNDVNHELRVNENVIRWAIVKKPDVPPMPNPAKLFWNHPKYGRQLRPPVKYPMPYRGIPNAR